MHSDKQNLFLTTFKKWVLAKKSGQIPHSALKLVRVKGFGIKIGVTSDPFK